MIKGGPQRAQLTDDYRCSREDNDENFIDFISTSPTYLVGLCTGMLPAAALAFSNSSTQLLELAPKIVCVSLRLGLEAARRSAQIESSNESWAVVVPGVGLQEQREILLRFHHVHVRSLNLGRVFPIMTELHDREYRAAKEPTSVQSQIRRQPSVGHLLPWLRSSRFRRLSGTHAGSACPLMQPSTHLTWVIPTLTRQLVL